MVSCTIRNPQIAHLQERSFPSHQAQPLSWPENTKVWFSQSYVFSLAIDTAKKCGEEFDLFSFPSCIICLRYLCLQHFSFVRMMNLMTERVLCHAKIVVREKLSDYSLLSAKERSRLPLPEILRIGLFRLLRRLQPVMSLKPPSFILIHKFKRHLAVPMTRQLHE